jgi:hypothetical protein
MISEIKAVQEYIKLKESTLTTEQRAALVDYGMFADNLNESMKMLTGRPFFDAAQLYIKIYGGDS